MRDTAQIENALREVRDPEVGINIVDMGLIYDVQVDDGTIGVKMTLTGPGCPAGPEILCRVQERLENLPGVEHVKVEVVWVPRWTPDMMSEAAKDQLGIL